MTEPRDTYAARLAAGQKALNLGRYDEAMTCFNAILENAPEDLPALLGVGLTLTMSGKESRGIEILETLDREHPGQHKIFGALGVAYSASGQFASAEICFRKALRIGGFEAATACNLGMALNELGQFDHATAMFKSCLRRNPNNDFVRYHLGLCQLLAGDYANGWEGFELRNRVAGRREPQTGGAIARWNGESLAGRSIILIAEQGLGDAINFARYATLAADAGASVYIRCSEALTGILQTVPGVSGTFSSGSEAPKADFQASLLSLPRLFGTTRTSIPGADGYLTVAKEAQTHWRKRLVSQPGTKHIGLIWAGNPENKTDRKRSIGLQKLLPVLDVPNTVFFSLQIGVAADEVAELPVAQRPQQVFSQPLPFEQVAAAVASLDLVISVDTSIAHLAGALGVPVWVPVSYVPDWRWGLSGDSTGWYASMQLFRQTAIGDWSAPVRNLRAALMSAKRES